MGHEDVLSAVRTPHRQTEYGVVKSTLRANDNPFQGFFKREVNRRCGAVIMLNFNESKPPPMILFPDGPMPSASFIAREIPG
jgi:N-dimethylarginine dimethylaminohydrolase